MNIESKLSSTRGTFFKRVVCPCCGRGDGGSFGAPAPAQRPHGEGGEGMTPDSFAIGVLPTWPHSREWGRGPSGLLGLVLVIVLVLFLLGYI